MRWAVQVASMGEETNVNKVLMESQMETDYLETKV
jgi:hypothetical protein